MTINFASRLGRAAKTPAALSGYRKAQRWTGLTHPENKAPGPERGHNANAASGPLNVMWVIFSYRNMDTFRSGACTLTNDDFHAFSKHLRRHAHDPYFVQSCQFCGSVFNSYRSWQRHLSVHIARLKDPGHSSMLTDST